MWAYRRDWPMIDLVKLRQPGYQDHRWLTNGQEHTLTGGVHHAPPGPSRKRTNPAPAIAEVNSQQLWATRFVADGGDRRQLQARAERNAIWSRTSRVDCPGSQRLR